MKTESYCREESWITYFFSMTNILSICEAYRATSAITTSVSRNLRV